MTTKIQKPETKAVKFFNTSKCILNSLFSVHIPRNAVPEQGACTLNALLAADLHTDGDFFRSRNNILRKAVTGMSRSCKNSDVLVLAGDITNAGHQKEYRILDRMLKYYNKSKEVLFQMGNHDSGGTSEDKTFEETSSRFQLFCKEHGSNINKNYYSRNVNGYLFLLLGTEQMLLNEAYLSSCQLNWLKTELSKAKISKKPVFVVCHQPLNGTLLPDGKLFNEGFGEQSDELKTILKEFTANGNTLLYISGHVHCGTTEVSLSNDGSLYALTLPSIQYDNGGGEGFYMEVYADKILLQARNFISSKLIKDAQFTINL